LPQLPNQVKAIPIPAHSRVHASLPGAYCADCYEVAAPDNLASALQLYLKAVAQTPAWVEQLMPLSDGEVVFADSDKHLTTSVYLQLHITTPCMAVNMNTSTTAPMSLRLDVSKKERLGRIASRQKRSSHSLALEALDTFIEKKEAEERWNQHCDVSLQDYLETGLHATEEEVDKWMESWGTASELPQPPCHV
jgi:predicted transcriptional regulator